MSLLACAFLSRAHTVAGFADSVSPLSDHPLMSLQYAEVNRDFVVLVSAVRHILLSSLLALLSTILYSVRQVLRVFTTLGSKKVWPFSS